MDTREEILHQLEEIVATMDNINATLDRLIEWKNDE
jgi:exonuclease VII small subunit